MKRTPIKKMRGEKITPKTRKDPPARVVEKVPRAVTVRSEGGGTTAKVRVAGEAREVRVRAVTGVVAGTVAGSGNVRGSGSGTLRLPLQLPRLRRLRNRNRNHNHHLS